MTYPTNNAKVVKPNAVPLLFGKVFANAVKVKGIVILNNNNPNNPQYILVGANINKIDAIIKEILETFQLLLI